MNDPKNLASKGRYGDTMLAHINPEEAALLKSRGGAGTINPKTGLPEFYWSSQQATKYLEEQKAAEKAASGKTPSAPLRALTPAERQANMARDLTLSQTRGARPSGQDSQFYQPAYQSQYANYTNPLTAFNVSNYGTNPGMSKSMQAATAPGAEGVDPYYKQLQSYSNVLSNMPGGANINTLLNDMRFYGISPQDMQSASSYSPPQPNYGGRYGGGDGYPDGNFRTQPYVDPSTGRSTGLADMPQMQTPFSYQQPMQQRQAPFNPYTNQYQTPFSYQQPMQQQQMQSPFSYQQPQQQMQQPMAQPNYGPSQAIVGRSSQMRGTPNVMRRAEGGIASLMDDVE